MLSMLKFIFISYLLTGYIYIYIHTSCFLLRNAATVLQLKFRAKPKLSTGFLRGELSQSA